MDARRLTVCALNAACYAIDEVAYRPAVVRLTERLPRWWRCELGRLAAWLDERWDTGVWGEFAGPGGACDACGRRAAWLDLGGIDPDDPDSEDFLARHRIVLCGWCDLDPAWFPIEDAETLRAALAGARARSVSWRWGVPAP
ncbi:MAG: hypothetical protein ABR583_13655 [Gaiellaceae bacterium]